MKRIVVVSMLCALVLVLGGCCLQHSWKEADCEHPKTCEKCGKTEGEALGHSWKQADCEHPKTCERCGKTEGEALGHSWKEADCEHPKTCERCGKTEGEALGHEYIWKQDSINIVCAEADCTGECSRCGKTTRERKNLDKLYDDEGFLFNVEEYVQRLQGFLRGNFLGLDVTVKKESTSQKSQYAILVNGEPFGILNFADQHENFLTGDQEVTGRIAYIIVIFKRGNEEQYMQAGSCAPAFIQACDPRSDDSSALEWVTNLMMMASLNEGVWQEELEGLVYFYGLGPDFTMLSVASVDME